LLKLQRLRQLRKDYSNRWQKNQRPTQKVDSSRVFAVDLRTFEKPSDLQSIGTRNRAGKVTGTDVLSILETQSLEILGRVTTVTKSSRSWSGPCRDFAKSTPNTERESGVNIFNCSESNFVSKKWVSNNEQVLAKFQRWNDVVGKDKTQGQQDYCCSLPASFWFGELEGVDERKAGHDDGKDCNQIAGRRSFHPVIFARKEQKNG